LLDVVHLPAETIRRIDERVREARALISGEVDRGAVVRAAVAAWFVDAKERPADIVHQAIRASLQSEPSLTHLPQSWPPEMAARLSQLATTAARALGRGVSCSAVVRAALAFWLDAAEERPASIVACAIQAAIVRRGGGVRP
jgi:Arc/MetJ-type ribon-helix-helix transcriptional regulator